MRKKREFNAYDSKWAHPECIEEDNYVVFHPLREIIEGCQGKTAEQNDEEREPWRGAFMETAYSTCDPAEKEVAEWKEHYSEHGCPEEPDAKQVRILVRTPKDIKEGERLPGIIFISGGGLLGGGTPELAVGQASRMMLESGVRGIIISPEYRLAVTDQYPAAVNDCHAAYLWMIENAEKLHIDTDKIIIAGGSTGGHLALSLTFRVKKYDYHGTMPRGVIAMEPVMDDVANTDSNRVIFENPEGQIYGWDHVCTKLSFQMWLGEDYGDPSLLPEVVPNRATAEDVKGFPPVWLPTVPEFDPARDSAYRFASLLHHEGIFCDFHEWGGCSHLLTGGDGKTALGKRIWNMICSSLCDAVNYDFRRPWLSEKQD